MASWQWSRAWKRAAKHHRRMADRYFVAWIKAVVKLGWRSRQARAWKAAAKRWRRRALAAEAALADLERGEWLRVQQPVEYEVK
jgi:hypothetical protein